MVNWERFSVAHVIKNESGKRGYVFLQKAASIIRNKVEDIIVQVTEKINIHLKPTWLTNDNVITQYNNIIFNSFRKIFI
jgi:hypothetical protein